MFFGPFLWQELKLEQKTPLRVLHRRPLAVRCRLIHTMSSEYIDEHHFRLHLKTQAGTYPWLPWHQAGAKQSLLVGGIGITGSFLLGRLWCLGIPALPQWCCCTMFAFRSQFHIGLFMNYVTDMKMCWLKYTSAFSDLTENFSPPKMRFYTTFNALQCRLEIAATSKLQFYPKVTQFGIKQNKDQQCSFWHQSQEPGIRSSLKDRYGLNRILTKKLLRSRKKPTFFPPLLLSLVWNPPLLSQYFQLH